MEAGIFKTAQKIDINKIYIDYIMDELVEQYLTPPPEPEIMNEKYIIDSLCYGGILNTDYHISKLVYWFLKNEYKPESQRNTIKWSKKIDDSWIVMKTDFEIKKILSEKLTDLIITARQNRRTYLRTLDNTIFNSSDIIIESLLKIEHKFYNTNYKSHILRESLIFFLK